MASPLGRSHTANTMASSSSLMQGFARQVACLITVPECDEPVFLAVQAHPSSGYDVLTHPVSPNDNFEDTVHQALLLQLGATIELRGILRFEVASPTDPVPMVTVVFLVDLPGKSFVVFFVLFLFLFFFLIRKKRKAADPSCHLHQLTSPIPFPTP